MREKSSLAREDGSGTDWVRLHSDVRARFLRRLSEVLDEQIIPQLDGEAAEVAGYTSFLTQRMAFEDDGVSEVAEHLNEAMTAESGVAMTFIAQIDAALACQLENELAASRAPGVLPEHRSRMLRGIMGRALRRLGGETAPGAQARVAALAALDHKWCDRRAAEVDARKPRGASGVTVQARITPDAVTEYLRARFPLDAEATCESVRLLPGGRSKHTLFIEVCGVASLPRQLVMRQDGSSGIDTSVVQEARTLESVQGAGLPIPQLLLCAPDADTLGKPFIFMDRLPGVPAGSYFGFRDGDAHLLRSVARLLARLHGIDVRGTPLAATAEPGARASILAELAMQEAKWHREAIEPSPIMEYGFHWVRNNLHRVPDTAGIVHGDYRPHNLLVEGSRVTGLLDWEFTHIGDPAEDLAYIRPTVLPVMAWDEFMAAYTGAGGQQHSEGTLLFYEAWNMIRLTASGVAGTSRFLSGVTDDLCDGIGGYFILPIHEQIISQNIRRAEAFWAR